MQGPPPPKKKSLDYWLSIEYWHYWHVNVFDVYNFSSLTFACSSPYIFRKNIYISHFQLFLIVKKSCVRPCTNARLFAIEGKYWFNFLRNTVYQFRRVLVSLILSKYSLIMLISPLVTRQTEGGECITRLFSNFYFWPSDPFYKFSLLIWLRIVKTGSGLSTTNLPPVLILF